MMADGILWIQPWAKSNRFLHSYTNGWKLIQKAAAKVQMNKNNTICLSSISSTAIQCSLLRYVLRSVIMNFFNDNISRAVTVGSSFFCAPNIMIVMTPNKIVLLFSHLSRIPRYAMLVVCVPCQPFCLLFVGIVWLALTLGNKVKKYVLTY